MSKYFLSNGKEVKLGDVLTRTSKSTHPLFGEYVSVEHFTLNKNLVPELLKAGVITEEKSSEDSNNLYPYVKKIADRMGWKVEKTVNYLNAVDSIMPMAAFNILLREIAVELDKKYEDHIENSPEIYVVSSISGTITKANKAHIKNYRNFAAFRTVDDARYACRLTKNILKRMFSNAKKG